jgi:acetyl-CoA carboxylase, biotin carboxylase subunit
VPMDYDPLLAKLIGYGSDRQQAIMRLQRALGEYFVAGIKTNISLFQRILCDADFRDGKLDTGYLDCLLAKGNQNVASRALEPGGDEKSEALEAIAAIAAGMFAMLDSASPVSSNGNAVATGSGPASVPSNWKQKGRSEALR